MKANLGSIDRIARIIVGISFGVLYFSGVVRGAGGILLMSAGFVLILTSLVASCPIYYLFGVSTCPGKQGPKKSV